MLPHCYYSASYLIALFCPVGDTSSPYADCYPTAPRLLCGWSGDWNGLPVALRLTSALFLSGLKTTLFDGSVDQALRGKHYRLVVRCILLWREALIQQRLRDILGNEELSDGIKKNLNILRQALTEAQEFLQKAHCYLEDDDGVKELTNRVYDKPGTDIVDFWISFMEMPDLLVQNIDSCHARNGSE